MARTLYDKLWDSHVVHLEDDGTALLYIDRHLVHEVTSPQAYEGLRVAGRKPWRVVQRSPRRRPSEGRGAGGRKPGRVAPVVAPADHNTPTTGWMRAWKAS